MTPQQEHITKLLTSTRVSLDVESFSNFFCVSISDLKDTTVTYIIDKYDDHREQLLYTLDIIDKNKYEVVTFNGKHYDCPVLNYVRLNPKCTTEQIKAFSDTVITIELWWDIPELKQYKYYHKWVDIDLFLYWSKMQRVSKKISLKGLAVQLQYPVIQELPIHHNAEVTDELRDTVLIYNAVHDMNIMKYMMEKVFNWQGRPSSFPEMIELRKEAIKIYGFKDQCMSWDATKLGINVAFKLNEDPIADPIEFNSFGELVSDKVVFQSEVFKDLLEKVKNQPRSNKIDYTIKFAGAILDMKEGGLHSSNNPKTYYSKPGYIFHSLDVSGYYPSLAEMLKVKMYKPLSYIKNQRIKLKHEGKGKTPEANLLKLSANALVGNLNMAEGEVYCPKSFYSITVNGQLFLFMLIEWLSKFNIEMVMANTDGFECYVPEQYYKAFLDTCKMWEQYTGLELEHFEYDRVYMLNVNSYLGVFKDGSYKEKGWFVTNPDLGNKVDFLSLPKAVNNYLLNKVPIQDTFESCNIYDFCGAQKIGRNYEVFYNGDKMPQRLNVYYVSNNGGYLLKRKATGSFSAISSLKGVKVNLFNEFVEGPYDIDYRYYKRNVEKMLKVLEDKQPTTLL